ncbi:hypothetical protein Tco_1340640 [Tanacetum coccineum]
MMKGSDIGIQEKKAKLFNEWERFTSTDGESIESYYHRFSKLINDFKRNKHFPKKIANNLKFLNNLQPEWSRHVTIVHQTKDLHTAYYTQLYDFMKYNQKENYMQQPMSNPEDIRDPTAAMNMALTLMTKIAHPGNQVVQNLGVQNVGNQNGVIVVSGIANKNGNGDVVAARAEGNANGNNGNQIRCYNCRGLCHLARNCTVIPRRRDAAYLQTQLLIAQKEEAGIQLQAEEFDLMAATADLDEIDVEQGGGTVEQHSANVEETSAHHESLFHNLAAEVEKLSKEKSTVSSLQEEKKRLKFDFKIREDELLNKEIQLENKTESFYHTEQKMALGYQNPFYLKQAQQKQQSLYNGKVLLEKHDPPTLYDSEETLELAQESHLKMKLLNKEIKLANYTKINHLSRVFVSQTAKSREELYLSNNFKMANVSKSISIPNEEFLDDTTPKVAKFVRDFQSLANEAVESLAKHKALELEVERLLRAVVNQDIMSIVQNNWVENEYAKLWNDWYKKCEECKYDKISYDKAYNDMQQKIERLQAQLGDQKGKCKDIPCVLNTLDPLPPKLENENVELEFQVRNYEKENAHLKTAYKNLFDFINVTQTQTKLIIDSLQNKLHDTIYENAKLRAQLFDKASEQKETSKGTSTNTKFANQSTERKPFLKSLRNQFVVRQPNAFQFERPNFSKTQIPQKVDKMNDLTNPVNSNSVPTTNESKVLDNDKVIAPGMFRINPFKNSREEKFVPNKPTKASVRINPIFVSQPHVIIKKVSNSDSNGFSSTRVDITTKTRRPQPRSNTKNDRVPFVSKSNRIKNKEVEVEDHPSNV